MKKTILCSLFMALALTVSAQLKVGTQFGGANWVGLSLNAGYEFQFNESNDWSIDALAGIGVILPYFGPNSIFNFQSNIYHKNIGLGIETAFHNEKPFYEKTIPSSAFIDLLAYPNISWRTQLSKHIYLSFSAGAYLAFSKYGSEIGMKDKFRFEGDVLPGIGISCYYKFNTRT